MQAVEMFGMFGGAAKDQSRSRVLQSRFTEVHERNLWGAEGSRSGGGSERHSGSVVVGGEALLKAVAENAVRSLNDIPCGDFNWMPEILAQIPRVRYIGFDIVRPALVRNKDRFPNVEFRQLDVTSQKPPYADLIFCKDLLNHLADDDVRRAIANMRRSGAKLLLASNNPGWENGPLPTSLGGSRHLDITAPPFNFPQPLWTLNGYMSLWRFEDLGDGGG